MANLYSLQDYLAQGDITNISNITSSAGATTNITYGMHYADLAQYTQQAILRQMGVGQQAMMNPAVAVAATPEEFAWLRKRVDDICWKA